LRATTRLLDETKKALGIESDYALAKYLDLSQQAISKLRRGIVMSNTTALKVAEILDRDLAKVIALLELERGSNDQLWKRFLDAAVVATFMIGAASFFMLPPSANAAGWGVAGDAHYVKSPRNSRRQWLERLLAWLRAVL
jgi:transcriptional regulator with XRE-family HTH domain